MSAVCRAKTVVFEGAASRITGVPPAYAMLGGKQAVPAFTSEIIVRYNNLFFLNSG